MFRCLTYFESFSLISSTYNPQDAQAKYKRRLRSEANEVEIPKCENPRRRKVRLSDPVKFLKGYFPDRFFRAFSNDQKEAIALIVNAATYEDDEIIAAPRGEWKTETTKGMIIYLILAKLIRFPVLIASTGPAAGMLFSDIKRQFEHNDLLAADFPEICAPIQHLGGSAQRGSRQTYRGKLTAVEWKQEHCIFASIPDSGYDKIAMTYRSLDGAIRGINIAGMRPDFALIDDPETRESANSDYQIANRQVLIDNDVGGLGSGGNTLTRVILGTVQNAKCLVQKKLKQWGGKRYQGVYKWPKATDLWEDYVETRRQERRDGDKDFSKSFALYRANRKAMDVGAAVASPDNYSKKRRKNKKPIHLSAIQRIYDEIADKGLEYVMTEVQNDPAEGPKPDTSGISAAIVASRKSGLQQFATHPDTMIVTAAIDLGKYWCHWVLTGWLENAAGYVIDYGVQEVPGVAKSTDNKAAELALFNSLLDWRNDIMQIERPPDAILVDSGDFTSTVYEFIRQVGGSPFMASKGTGESRFRHGIASDTRIVGKNWFASFLEQENLWLYNLDTDHWKTWTHERFLTPTFDEHNKLRAGSLSLFVDENDARRHQSFSQHQVAEEKVEEFIPGKGLKRYWTKTNRNNHWLDAMYMACAAAGMKGIELPLGPRMPRRAQPQEQSKLPQSSGFESPGGRPYLVTERT